MATTFDAYEANLIMVAADADDIMTAGDTPILWADSFTREMVEVFTRDAADIIETAFDGALPGDVLGVDDVDAEDVRAGIVERITDDIICALPDGYTLATTEPHGDSPRLLHIIRPATQNGR